MPTPSPQPSPQSEGAFRLRLSSLDWVARVRAALLDKPRIRQFREIRNRLDYTRFKQQIRRLFAELCMLASEEFLVRSFVLPA